MSKWVRSRLFPGTTAQENVEIVRIGWEAFDAGGAGPYGTASYFCFNLQFFAAEIEETSPEAVFFPPPLTEAP
jgi:hypothetical protein